jgi:hypothetical protein
MKNLLTNWKTTLAGAIALLIQLGPVLFPKYITPAVANTISIIAGSLGIVVAKDGNVTGGNTTQPSK